MGMKLRFTFFPICLDRYRWIVMADLVSTRCGMHERLPSIIVLLFEKLSHPIAWNHSCSGFQGTQYNILLLSSVEEKWRGPDLFVRASIDLNHW